MGPVEWAQWQEARPSTFSRKQRMPATSKQEDSDTPVKFEFRKSAALTHDSLGESSLESEGEAEEEPQVPDDDSEDPDYETSNLQRFFSSRTPHDKGEEAWRVCLPHPGTGHKKIRDSRFVSVQLRKFLKFVNSQYTDDMPNLNQHIKNTLRLSEGQIGGWRSSVLILPASTPASNTSARVLMSSNPRRSGQSKIQVITMRLYNTLPKHERAGTWDRRSLSLIETWFYLDSLWITTSVLSPSTMS